MDVSDMCGMPAYLDDREPSVDDPSLPYDRSHWFGARPSAQKLARCLESLRDVKRMLQALESGANPGDDRRGAKIMVTPLYALVIGLRELYPELEGNAE